jgi:hypothetical protein
MGIELNTTDIVSLAVGGIAIVIAVYCIIGVLRWPPEKNESADTTTPVIEDTFEDQRVQFDKMTVPQLKKHVKENKNKLVEPMGRMPTRKADLVETSLRIWTQEK